MCGEMGCLGQGKAVTRLNQESIATLRDKVQDTCLRIYIQYREENINAGLGQCS